MCKVHSIASRPAPIPAVTASVTPYIRLECKFWQVDHGWNGEALGLIVHAPDLQLAKNYMEAALGRRIEELLAISDNGGGTHAAQESARL